MRFLCVYRPADVKDVEAGVPPSQEEMAKMGKLIEEMSKAGVLVATEGCQPTSKGARIRLSGGRLTVTDGPFTETKEIIAGFALIQVKSKAEAIEWSKRFIQVAGDGETEIRQVFEGGECGAEHGGAEDRQRAQMAAKR